MRDFIALLIVFVFLLSHTVTYLQYAMKNEYPRIIKVNRTSDCIKLLIFGIASFFVGMIFIGAIFK